MQNIILKTFWLPVVGLLIGLIVAIAQCFKEGFDLINFVCCLFMFTFLGAIAMGVCNIICAYACLLSM
jgi:hypothetical protein